MALVAPSERHELEKLDGSIEAWIATLHANAEPLAANIDPDQIIRLVETSKQWAMQLDQRLPPSLDPSAVAELRGIMIDALREIEAADDERPLDVLNNLVARAEAIRHIIRDALDEQLGIDTDDARAIARLLDEWLPRVTRKQMAELLGVDERRLYRWLNKGGEPTHRLTLVARLVNLLRGVWTPEGVVAWFYRPRPELGSAAIDLLDDASQEKDLIEIARQGRAQHGS